MVIDGSKLEVRDHGSGFTDADLPHVFDRFYRSVEARTQSGSGLGLAIVRQAVERHGGTVWAANRAGGGRGGRLRAPDRDRASPSSVLTSAARQGAGACVSRSASAFWSPSRAAAGGVGIELDVVDRGVGTLVEQPPHGRAVAVDRGPVQSGSTEEPGMVDLSAPPPEQHPRATSMLPLRHAR